MLDFILSIFFSPPFLIFQGAQEDKGSRSTHFKWFSYFLLEVCNSEESPGKFFKSKEVFKSTSQREGQGREERRYTTHHIMYYTTLYTISYHTTLHHPIQHTMLYHTAHHTTLSQQCNTPRYTIPLHQTLLFTTLSHIITTLYYTTHHAFPHRSTLS